MPIRSTAATLLLTAAGACFAQSTGTPTPPPGTSAGLAPAPITAAAAHQQLHDDRSRITADHLKLKNDKAAGNTAAVQADIAQLHSDRAAYKLALAQAPRTRQGHHVIEEPPIKSDPENTPQ